MNNTSLRLDNYNNDYIQDHTVSIKYSTLIILNCNSEYNY